MSSTGGKAAAGQICNRMAENRRRLVSMAVVCAAVLMMACGNYHPESHRVLVHTDSGDGEGVPGSG